MELEPIGYVSSPFREKFGAPRQPLLAPAATGWLELVPPFDDPDAVQGLEQSTHVWLIFRFHQVVDQGWRSRVRPPRLGGNKRRGVFATRSPFRPNHLGLSVVELLGVETSPEGVRLRLGGLDLVDGTPVLDVKPYVPYVDAVPGARSGFADQAPDRREVRFTGAVPESLSGEERTLIAQVLGLDPRPAYRDLEDDKVYTMDLGGRVVRFRSTADAVEVIEVGIED